MKTELITDFTTPAFAEAFKLYFAELGINVTKWDALFAEMSSDPRGRNYAYLRTDGERTVGFIMFAEIKAESWFFESSLGFVREFWVASDCRGEGHGSELLALAEEHFRREGLPAAILTTDTAVKFYESRGYRKIAAVRAKNGDDVYVKPLN